MIATTVQKDKILFKCKTNESVYDCLSRQINAFNLILNNKVCISTIVHRAKKEDCELNSQQTILIINRIQYLKYSHLFMLQKDASNCNIKHSDC